VFGSSPRHGATRRAGVETVFARTPASDERGAPPGGLATALFAFHLWLGFNKRRVGLDALDWSDDDNRAPAPNLAPVSANATVMVKTRARVHSFFETEPWFLYFVGGSGAFCAATAWLGLAGAENGNVCCLGLYAHQVAVSYTHLTLPTIYSV